MNAPFFSIQFGSVKYRWVGLALIILSMLVNCTGKTIYYRQGGNQYRFDLDSKACLEEAEIMARSKMVNQEATPDPALVQKFYEGCLFAKGWSRIPLDQRDRSLWQWKDKDLSFKTFRLELPPGFSLRTERKWVFGPTWIHQLQAEGPDRMTHLILVAQENMAGPFEIIDYPTPEGHIFYTGGHLDRFDLRWSVFTGHHRQNLIAILGVYIYLEKTRRVSVVFSRALSPSGPPVRGYTLSPSQKAELDQTYTAWLSWIKAQTGAEEAEEKPGLRHIFRVFW